MRCQQTKTIRLADLGRIVTGRTPSNSDAVAFGGSIPFVTPSDMNGVRWVEMTERQLSRIGAEAIANAHLPRQSVMVTCIGTTIGRVAVAATDCFTNQQINSIVVDESINPLFVYYSLLLRGEGLRKIASGSAQPIVNKSTFGNLTIEVPNRSIQDGVVNTLSAIDDKIELNRQMNQTLEQIAAALFRSWFIDFDPVRAKMAGREPEGMDAATAALFPERLVESELGEIPEGWQVATLADICIELRRGISPKYTESEGVLVLNQRCVRDHRVDLSKARRHDSSSKRVEGRLLAAGDVLINSTGVGTLGRVAQLLEVPEAMVADSHLTVARAKPDRVTTAYLGQLALSIEADIEALGEGSTGQTELSRVRLGSIPVVIPPTNLLQDVDPMFTAINQKIQNGENESNTLAALRDALLPRLLSGELRVLAEVLAAGA